MPTLLEAATLYVNIDASFSNLSLSMSNYPETAQCK